MTRTLDLAGLVSYDMVRQEVLARKSQIGTYTHEWARYLDEGTLDWDAFSGNPSDQDIKGRVQAWANFKRDTKFRSRVVEERYIGQMNGMTYGLTVDRIGFMGHSDIECVVELKTPEVCQPWYATQTAGYALGVPDLDNKAASPRVLFARRRRMVVQLFPDGDYKKTDYKEFEDLEVFLSCLHIATWKLNHGSRIRKIEV